MVEFACFGPKASSGGMPMTEANKLRLFESFWESGDARAGEVGAQGWGAWVERSKSLTSTSRGGGKIGEGDDRARRTDAAMFSRVDAAAVDHMEEGDKMEERHETHGGAEDGLMKKVTTDEGTCVQLTSAREEDESDDDDDGEEDEDEDAVLSRLGLQFDKAATAEVDDASLELWLAKEAARDTAQWQPLREWGNSGNDGEVDDDDPDPLRVVCFDDIREGLTDFTSEAARMRLLTRVLELLGCPLHPWDGAADPGLADRLNSAEHPSGPFAAFIHRNESGEQEAANIDCSDMRWFAAPLPEIPGEPPAWLCPPGGAEATWVNAVEPATDGTFETTSGGDAPSFPDKSRAVFLAQLLDLAAGAFPAHAPLALARIEQERCSKGTSAAKVGLYKSNAVDA
jgi:hypothetical protein